jgi:CheY-like chemotaxis protein
MEVFMIDTDKCEIENSNTNLESALALNGIKVLAVDDLPNNLELIKILLETYGAEVTIATSVREALTILNSLKIDVLISDIQMPGEDGYDLIRQVRQLPNKIEIPALALTANDTKSDREQAFLSGFQCYITKPFETAELVAKIVQLIRY